MSDPVRIDMARLTADLEALKAEEDAAEREADLAVARALAVRNRREKLSDFLSSLRTYAVQDDEGNVPVDVPVGPLAGMSGAAAVGKFVADNPGEDYTVEGMHSAMTGLGFTGTTNAVNVALVAMANEGKVSRVKRGLYHFPIPLEAADTAREVFPFRVFDNGGGG